MKLILITNRNRKRNMPEENYGTYLLKKNFRNMLSFEQSISGSQIRIDGIKTSDEDSFKKLIIELKRIAGELGCKRLFYADSKDERIISLFKACGFIEEASLDCWNCYLSYEILPAAPARKEAF